MWDKIKDAVFHRVTTRAAAAAVAAGTAYLARPEVVAGLAAAGITIDPTKLAGFAVTAVTFLLALAYYFIEHKAKDATPPVAPVSK